MSWYHYIVADQYFRMAIGDAEMLNRLAFRYGPFEVSSSDVQDRTPLFSLEMVDALPTLADAKEMARFDCDGAKCVFSETDTQVDITLLSPDGSDVYARMVCDIDFKEIKVLFVSPDEWLHEYAINNYLMMVFAFATMPTQTLLFHASVVSNEEKAYLFLGHSGTGKSTHSGLWLKYIAGSELVNDDNPAVGVRDGQVFVYGTPWSGKTPCYRNVKYPVGAFVRLHQEKENKIEKMMPVQAFASLLPSCSGVMWNKRLRRAQCDTITEVVKSVPVYLLGCLPDEDAAQLCHDTVTVGA